MANAATSVTAVPTATNLRRTMILSPCSDPAPQAAASMSSGAYASRRGRRRCAASDLGGELLRSDQAVAGADQLVDLLPVDAALRQIEADPAATREIRRRAHPRVGEQRRKLLTIGFDRERITGSGE